MCVPLLWFQMTGRSLLAKGGKLGLVLVQCGCIAHCFFEFVADFVVVSFPVIYIIHQICTFENSAIASTMLV